MWLELTPNDVLFFRGPEPFNAGESGYVPSQFPPTPRTLQGALRTALLEANGVSIEEYVNGRVSGPVVEALGRADEEIRLDLRGPYLTIDGKLCVPAPLDLVEKDSKLASLAPSQTPTTTDLGPVMLPESPDEASRVEGKWVPLEDLERLLAGEEVSAQKLFSPLQTPAEGSTNSAGIFPEPKVGLARNPDTQTAREGMLYTISTLRAGDTTGFAVRIDGLPQETPLPELVKWGGEGRFAWSRWMETPVTGTHRKAVATRIDDTGKFRLVFLQPALFGEGWLPEGFERAESEGALVWRGELGGVECTLVSASLDKPRHIGGWDMKKKRSHPLRPHVPAGSVYFFETQASGQEVVETLDDGKIGEHTNMGFGHVLTGGQ